jgi:hypothetical protein
VVEHRKATNIAMLARQYTGATFLKLEQVATCDLCNQDKPVDSFRSPGFILEAVCRTDCAERQIREGKFIYRLDSGTSCSEVQLSKA